MRSRYRDLTSIRRLVSILLTFVTFFAYIQLMYLDSWSKLRRFQQRTLLDVHTMEYQELQNYNLSTRHTVFDRAPEKQTSSMVSNDGYNFTNIYPRTFNNFTMLNSQRNHNETSVDIIKKENFSSNKPKTNPGKVTDILPLKRRVDIEPYNTSKPLMLLFSSWVQSYEKLIVHSTTIRLWSSWHFIKPAVFTTDPEVQRYATLANWGVLPVKHVHPECHGPPVLAPMFNKVMNKYDTYYYGFANSDILFGEGLAETLKFLHEYDAWRTKPLMIVGRRHNVNFVKRPNITINTPTDVAELTKIGSLVIRSTDYYFTNKHFPWSKVPEVSIGRPYVVRAIIGFALKRKIAVIDATNTIEAVHLTTEDGKMASWKSKGVKCNEKIMNKLHWRVPVKIGHCECALLETFKQNNTLKVRHRKADKSLC